MKKLVFILLLFVSASCFSQDYDFLNLDVVNFLFHGTCYSLVIEDDYAYTTAGAYFQIYDISDPAAPELVSEIDLGNATVNLAILDGYVYAAHDSAGISIIDISDPSLLEVVDDIYRDYFVHSIEIVGDFAYICAGGNGFRIMNVYDPSSPVEIYSYVLPHLDVRDVEIDSIMGYAYIIDDNYPMKILDITNPYSPLEVSSDTDIRGSSLIKTDEFLFTYPFFYTVDVSDPSSPGVGIMNDYLYGSYPPISDNMEIKDNYLFVADSFLFIYDFSEPEDTIPLVASYRTYGRAANIIIDGDIAYIADVGGLGIYNISDIHDIELLSYTFTAMYMRNSQKYGDYIFGFNHQIYRNMTLDISDPVNPSIAKVYDMNMEKFLFSSSDLLGLVYIDYLGNYIYDYNFDDVYSPSLYSDFPVNTSSLEKIGNYVFVRSGNTIRIIDYEDPYSPELIDSLLISSEYVPTYYETCMYSHDSLLFVKCKDSLDNRSFRVFSITTPLSITEVCEIPYIYEPRFLYFYNDILMLASGGIQFIDFSNPSLPVSIGSIDLYVDKIEMNGSIGVVRTTRGKIEIYDFSDLMSPVLLGFFEPEYSATDFILNGRYIYVYSNLREFFSAGLYVLDISSLYESTSIELSCGWNLISYPFEGTRTLDYEELPIIEPTYSFNSEIYAYELCSELIAGKGYWLLTESDDAILYDDVIPVHSLEITLRTGWNLIGGLNEPLPMTYFTDLPVVAGPCYEYDPATGSYFDSDTLRPQKGYWILATDSVTVHLP